MWKDSKMKRLRTNRGYRGFTLIELMVVVGITTILAAISIPVFGKYIKKAKTSEAGINLRKIYDGEAAYYAEDQYDRLGQVLSKQFIYLQPQPNPPGPKKKIGNFSGPGWQAIKFGVDSPVYFSYQVSASGVGTESSFTARARGDFDGDGLFLLFERVGSVDSSTGEVVGGAALFYADEVPGLVLGPPPPPPPPPGPPPPPPGSPPPPPPP